MLTGLQIRWFHDLSHVRQDVSPCVLTGRRTQISGGRFFTQARRPEAEVLLTPVRESNPCRKEIVWQ